MSPRAESITDIHIHTLAQIRSSHCTITCLLLTRPLSPTIHLFNTIVPFISVKGVRKHSKSSYNAFSTPSLSSPSCLISMPLLSQQEVTSSYLNFPHLHTLLLIDITNVITSSTHMQTKYRLARFVKLKINLVSPNTTSVSI